MKTSSVGIVAALEKVCLFITLRNAFDSVIAGMIVFGVPLIVLNDFYIYTPITTLPFDILFAGFGYFCGFRLGQTNEHCRPVLNTLKRMGTAFLVSFVIAAIGVHKMHIPNTFFGQIFNLILLMGMYHALGANFANSELTELLFKLDCQLDPYFVIHGRNS